VTWRTGNLSQKEQEISSVPELLRGGRDDVGHAKSPHQRAGGDINE